jgi:hypothetical protein
MGRSKAAKWWFVLGQNEAANGGNGFAEQKKSDWAGT